MGITEDLSFEFLFKNFKCRVLSHLMRLLAESKRVVVATYNNSSLRIGIIDLNSPLRLVSR